MTDYNKNLPSSTIIHRWKRAGATLTSALSDYLELCLLLSEPSKGKSVTRTDLVSQLDSVLQPGGLFTGLFNNLIKSQEVTTKARNRLVSPIYSFPTEILSQIFLHFIYAKEFTSPTFVKYTVRKFYYHLHTLLGVCSTWRSVGVSMPILWNLIPVIRDPGFSLSYEGTSLSLDRSGTLPLDLAVMIPYVVPDKLVADLTKHASRFRSANIIAQVPHTIQDIMEPLMERNITGSLSELSLCVADLEHIDRLGDELYYMFPPERDSSKNHLPQLIQSLTRFRFGGATFDWTHITFSSRLVELRVYSVILGYDSYLHEFLRVISTAPELKQLELSSLISFPEPNTGTPPKVTLPKLESLFLDDLYFNTLSIALRSIVPISHQLTLSITNSTVKTIRSVHPSEVVAVGTTELQLLLKGVSIDTLLLGEQDKSPSRFLLKLILNAIPSLNTLKVDEWLVDWEFCNLFTWREPRFNSWGLGIPKIQKLYLTSVKIGDQHGLKELVLSHGLELIFLSGYLNYGSEQDEDWKPLMIWEEIVEWLADNVPQIQLVQGSDYRSPEFQSAIWQL